jgi:hypothetical protein
MDSGRKFKAHPQSAPGDFYVVNGECVTCGAPHAVAPDLIGWATGPGYSHCIWKKQPETELELAQAFDAFAASCVGCYRYAGNDPAVIERIGAEYCDRAFPAASAADPLPGTGNGTEDFHFTLTTSAPARSVLLAANTIRRMRSRFLKKS